MTLEEWEAWEASYYEAEDPEQLRVDLLRIRGYALACADAAVAAREAVEKAIDAAARAQKKAARELEKCRRACVRAERASTFASRAMAGDVAPDVRREAAAALEELFG